LFATHSGRPLGTFGRQFLEGQVDKYSWQGHGSSRNSSPGLTIEHLFAIMALCCRPTPPTHSERCSPTTSPSSTPSKPARHSRPSREAEVPSTPTKRS